MSGKNYQAAAAGRDPEAMHEAREAIEQVKAKSFAKFDESVDAAFRLGIDPKHADQLVRGTVSLPAGTGKSIRIAVFATGDKAKEAEAAGADIVGGKELVEEINSGKSLDFDLTIATPDIMSEVGKLGKVLGPRNLMPNPKAGTVTFDVGKTVEEFKAGKVEYRNDKNGNVHTVIGKGLLRSRPAPRKPHGFDRRNPSRPPRCLQRQVRPKPQALFDDGPFSFAIDPGTSGGLGRRSLEVF